MWERVAKYMPKYSTAGRGGSGEGTACELCGKPTEDLTEVTISGAELFVCNRCVPHDNGDLGERESEASASVESEESPAENGVQEEARGEGSRSITSETSPLWNGDTTHWEEEGVSYTSDRLPHLVPDYADRVQKACEDTGLTLEDVGDELQIGRQELHAVEQGNAVAAEVAGSTITALEDYLDVNLTE